MVWGSNPGGGEIFRIRPCRLWGPPILLHNNGYRVFPGGKAAGAWRWSSTPSVAEVEGRVELYICSPSGPSWTVIGGTLPLPLPIGLVFAGGRVYQKKGKQLLTCDWISEVHCQLDFRNSLSPQRRPHSFVSWDVTAWSHVQTLERNHTEVKGVSANKIIELIG